MHINKAIITAAGKTQSHLPLQTVVDRSGEVRTALDLLLDEVTGAGIDEVAIIIRPGEEERYRQALGSATPKLTFFEQHDPRGMATRCFGLGVLQQRSLSAYGCRSFVCQSNAQVVRGAVGRYRAARAVLGFCGAADAREPVSVLWSDWRAACSARECVVRSEHVYRKANANDCRATSDCGGAARWALPLSVWHPRADADDFRTA